ncbi:hypothetical protein BHE74_00019991 [Ensete ventricosum]|nr:hypothetical protein BHE74_00019991 [Ensete ventricosum]
MGGERVACVARNERLTPRGRKRARPRGCLSPGPQASPLGLGGATFCHLTRAVVFLLLRATRGAPKNSGT